MKANTTKKGKRGASKLPRIQRMADLDWRAILSEMDASDDRTAAIVAAGFLENNLAMALLAKLWKLDEKEQEELFEKENSLLNTFHAKIQLGYALGLYFSETRDDLRYIKLVRNIFAHRLDVRSFDNSEISKLCIRLKTPAYLAYSDGKPEVVKNRDRYLYTASHLIARFDMEASTPQRPAVPVIPAADIWFAKRDKKS